MRGHEIRAKPFQAGRRSQRGLDAIGTGALILGTAWLDSRVSVCT